MRSVLSRLGGTLGRGWRRTARSAALIPQALEAVVTLPRQLEVIAFHTATLQEMHAEIAALRGDTRALPRIQATLEEMAVLLERVDGNTAAVERLAEIAVPLEGAAARLGRLADRWPARVPVRTR